MIKGDQDWKQLAILCYISSGVTGIRWVWGQLPKHLPHLAACQHCGLAHQAQPLPVVQGTLPLSSVEEHSQRTKGDGTDQHSPKSPTTE